MGSYGRRFVGFLFLSFSLFFFTSHLGMIPLGTFLGYKQDHIGQDIQDKQNQDEGFSSHFYSYEMIKDETSI